MVPKIHIVVRHNGAGWQVLTIGHPAESSDLARPYADRAQALSDALFSARMLSALGEEVEVLLEGSDGVKPVTEESSQVWLRH
jgi:tRNA(His) 5'-end guanylyltransferase